ncbi:hypothetical protein IW262DRAFT_888916 [Armillaria fumosa]|nr:hypothetical protein IW262DRAFT_888916 [Armillaria fumosa]
MLTLQLCRTRSNLCMLRSTIMMGITEIGSILMTLRVHYEHQMIILRVYFIQLSSIYVPYEIRHQLGRLSVFSDGPDLKRNFQG